MAERYNDYYFRKVYINAWCVHCHKNCIMLVKSDVVTEKKASTVRCYGCGKLNKLKVFVLHTGGQMAARKRARRNG